MSKHTPGPWEVTPENPTRVNVAMNTFLHPDEPRLAIGDEQDDDGFHDDWNICECGGDMFSRSDAECAANARLIAAAPTLLAALKALVQPVIHAAHPHHTPETYSAAIEQAKNAIALAEGGAK